MLDLLCQVSYGYFIIILIIYYVAQRFQVSILLGLVEVKGSSSSSSSASSYFGRRLPADSCRGRCQEGVSRDGTCRCDALCELTGSCCDDFLRSCRRSLGKFYNFCFRGIRCRTLIVHTCLDISQKFLLIILYSSVHKAEL